MIEEYAVEPKAVKTWASFRYIVEKFGIENGLVISRFPKKWPALVMDAMTESSFLNRARMTERLAELKQKESKVLVSFGRSFEPGDSWQTNVVRSHRDRPFGGVISEKKWSGFEDAVPVEDADEKVFKHVREAAVERKAESLSAACAPLLSCSREIVLVDPYFRPRDQRFLRTIALFLRDATQGAAKIVSIEIHTKFKNDDDTFNNFRVACTKGLGPLLPRGLELRVFRWQERSGDGDNQSERLHARYLLTERGGIRSEGGWDEGTSGQTTDLSLLAKDLWELRRQEYRYGSSAFAPADVDEAGKHQIVIVEGQR